jgi:hypothetical protein
MKRLLVTGLALGIILSVFATTTNVDAKTTVKTYQNCTALNKVYKGGVAKYSTTKNKGGKTRYKPYASTALYNANKKLDRDKDSIACEK